MRTAHPRKYPIRRKNQRQRQLYMLHKEEVLLNEITQPHYPTEHRFPDYEAEMAHPYSTRHLEENHKLGDAIEATEVYGPDNILLRKCEEALESARAGFLGLVLMAGDPGETMEDHIYYDEKFKFMKSGANIVKFPDHIVHCLINTKRADLKPIQQVLLGAEEGEESNLFFVTKNDTENLKKVLAAIDNHPYMVLMGGVIDDECYTARGILEWTKLSHEKELGEVLGLMSSPAQTLVSMLENSGSSELVRILEQSSRGTTDLLGQYLNDNESENDS